MASSARILHLLAVLVHAGEEAGLTAVQPLEARHHVRQHLHSVPDMWRRVGVVVM